METDKRHRHVSRHAIELRRCVNSRGLSPCSCRAIGPRRAAPDANAAAAVQRRPEIARVDHPHGRYSTASGRLSAVSVDLSRRPFRPDFTSDARAPLGYDQTTRACALRPGSRNGGRATGGEAMGRNPVPIVISCHRVLCGRPRAWWFSAPGEQHKGKVLGARRRALRRRYSRCRDCKARQSPERRRTPDKLKSNAGWDLERFARRVAGRINRKPMRCTASPFLVACRLASAICCCTS